MITSKRQFVLNTFYQSEYNYSSFKMFQTYVKFENKKDKENLFELSQSCTHMQNLLLTENMWTYFIVLFDCQITSNIKDDSC